MVGLAGIVPPIAHNEAAAGPPQDVVDLILRELPGTERMSKVIGRDKTPSQTHL